MRQANKPEGDGAASHSRSHKPPCRRRGDSQSHKPAVRRRKRCLCCGELFEPDPRTKGKQRYCSASACQNKRQRQNESAWRERNPDCLAEQYKRSRLWYQSHPGYSRQRRANNPGLARENRRQTKERSQKARARRVFDKSKAILTQLVGAKPDKCYLTHRARWLLVGLTKASLLLKPGSLWDNRGQWKQMANRLPKGRLYKLS